MKKILSVLGITLTVVGLTSCNPNSHKQGEKKSNPFEEKARKQMYATVKEVIGDSDKYSLTDEKVVFSNDSTCVISFTSRSNTDSSISPLHLEYYFTERHIKGKVKTEEAMGCIDEEEPFINIVNKAYKDDKTHDSFVDECKKRNIDYNSEEGKKLVATTLATITTALRGREVYTNND